MFLLRALLKSAGKQTLPNKSRLMPAPENNIIKWIDTYELGVPEIDGDHRTLVTMMQRISKIMLSDDRKRFVALFDRITDFAQSHFEREEILLRQWGYPDAAGHARYHQHLMAQALELKRSCLEQETPATFQECCQNMVSFIIDDVVRGDLKLKSFLQDRGLTT